MFDLIGMNTFSFINVTTIFVFFSTYSLKILKLLLFYFVINSANSITYTMMLLIGMWISLTKNPMKPMMQNPIAVAIAIFWNSVQERKDNT